MGAPVSADVLFAYLEAKHGSAEKIVSENFAESCSQSPGSVLGWIGGFCQQADATSGVVAELVAALESMPTMGEKFKEFIKAAQVAEMCETYSYLVGEWNLEEGPASQRRLLANRK